MLLHELAHHRQTLVPNPRGMTTAVLFWVGEACSALKATPALDGGCGKTEQLSNLFDRVSAFTGRKNALA